MTQQFNFFCYRMSDGSSFHCRSRKSLELHPYGNPTKLKLRKFLAKMRYVGSPAKGHGWVTKWIHWFALALLVFATVENGEASGALFHLAVMQQEVYVGLVLTSLYAFLWFWVRGPDGGTRLPVAAPWWEQRLSRLVHVCIYVAIGAILFSGFAMAYFAASDVVVDARAEVVLNMSSRFSLLRGVHLAGLVILARLLALHLVGALWHRFVRRDGVMQSISLFKRDVQIGDPTPENLPTGEP